MKGNPVVISKLDELLAEELTAINEYMVEAEMCENWGYERLHQEIQKIAIQEMKHAEYLIQRILFLEGTPTVSKLNQLHIGSNVENMLANGLAGEISASAAYNQAIRLCADANDNGSRELLKNILKDEEEHIDWLEAQIDQVKQMGLPIYLAGQAR